MHINYNCPFLKGVMENFTPFPSLIGGALIGVSAIVLMLLNGRIAGVSGITAGLLTLSGPVRDLGWRLAFVGGLILAPILVALVRGDRPEVTFVASMPTMIVAGLLVGFGTVIGNGCTSGHGVCGIARLSPRSFAATAMFMVAGIATAFVVLHVRTGAGP